MVLPTQTKLPIRVEDSVTGTGNCHQAGLQLSWKKFKIMERNEERKKSEDPIRVGESRIVWEELNIKNGRGLGEALRCETILEGEK